MTARKPLVPPELRELLTLLPDLVQLPPSPGASGTLDAWDRREDLKSIRQSLLRVCLPRLASTLDIGEEFPAGAAERLADHCRREVEYIRQCLAEPLGYEPEATP